MSKEKLATVHSQIKKELDASIAFWQNNAPDNENGGIYTCLNKTGKVYSTDKSVWMQGRGAWMFSHLCTVYGAQEKWLNIAESCVNFMQQYCISQPENGRMYFTVTAKGRPLRQRRYCFSEAFYAMGNAEYYSVTKNAASLKNAQKAYELIWQLNNGLIKDPAGLPPKTLPQTRTGRALADPMIYLNLSSIMRRCNPENAALYDERAAACAQNIIKFHHKPQLGATLETVGETGEFWSGISAGRVVNPGHSMECAWFLLDFALQQNNAELQKNAIEMFDYAYDIGWDKEYGGLLYFTDVLGNPPESYEHDMKLWWPHNELLIAALKIYAETKEQKYLDIFLDTWDYALNAFSEPEYGEWYGYLRRDGKPTMPAAKGSTFKGPFHLPRMLVMVDKMLENLQQEL